MKTKIKIASSIILSVLFSGCGGIGLKDTSSDTTKPLQTAQTTQNSNSSKEASKDKNSIKLQNTSDEEMIYEAKLVDSPIKGVKFECGDLKGLTDEEGTFRCISLPVKFEVGKVKLGEIDKIPEDKIVTLQDLSNVPRDDVENEKVAKLAVFVQSLDDDGKIEENINIDEKIARKLQESIEIQNLSLEKIKELLAKAGASKVVSKEEAIEHVKKHHKSRKSSKNKTKNNLKTQKDLDKNILDKKDGFSKEDLLKDPLVKPVKIQHKDPKKTQEEDEKNTQKTNKNQKKNIPTPTLPKDENKKQNGSPRFNQPLDDSKEENKDNESNNNQKNSNDKEKLNKNEKKDLTNTQEEKEINKGQNSLQKTYLKVDDNIFVNDKKDVLIYIDPKLNKNEKLIYNHQKVQEITKKIYNYVKDEYDFIFLVTNNKSRPKNVTYAGVMNKIKNDVKGIGIDLYDNTQNYGSNGKLKGIMHFAYRGAILRGPTLHEIAHYWANKFRNFKAKDDGSSGYHLGTGSHWGYTGFFGGKGQLGGFDAKNGDFRYENQEFTRKDGTIWKLYSAKSFSWNANGGNRIPYNDVELYLMGMLPKSQVKDLMIPVPWGSSLSPEEKTFVRENNIAKSGRTYFTAIDVIRKSWSDILAEHNIPDREPSYLNSQKNFRILTVLLDTKMPKSFEVDIVSSQIESLGYKGYDKDPNNYNFWEATRGVGSLSVSGIDKALESTPEEIEIRDDFKSETIQFRGKIYKTVKSPYTGRVWLDRNIGANRVCEDFEDKECFGYYFQFGRGFDGHQLPNSPTTTKKKESVTQNDNKFVLVGHGPRYDWLESGIDDLATERLEFAKKLDGTGICPAGFRLPSTDELLDETSHNEMGDKFPGKSINSNFLKLPMNGYRNSQNDQGRIIEIGERGAYWTTGSYEYQNSIRIRHILFDKEDTLSYGTRYLANGDGIRCIKDEN